MRVLEFLKRVHRNSGGGRIPGLRDPLDALSSIVQANPSSPRARAIVRVLIALRDKRGEFDESHLWALDAEAQQLLTALVNDQLSERYAEAEVATVVEVLACSTSAKD